MLRNHSRKCPLKYCECHAVWPHTDFVLQRWSFLFFNCLENLFIDLQNDNTQLLAIKYLNIWTFRWITKIKKISDIDGRLGRYLLSIIMIITGTGTNYTAWCLSTRNRVQNRGTGQRTLWICRQNSGSNQRSNSCEFKKDKMLKMWKSKTVRRYYSKSIKKQRGLIETYFYASYWPSHLRICDFSLLWGSDPSYLQFLHLCVQLKNAKVWWFCTQVHFLQATLYPWTFSRERTK